MSKDTDKGELRFSIIDCIDSRFLEVWSSVPKVSSAINDLAQKLEACDTNEHEKFIEELVAIKHLTHSEYTKKAKQINELQKLLYEEYFVQFELLDSLLKLHKSVL